jgi:hypothetical protein
MAWPKYNSKTSFCLWSINIFYHIFEQTTFGKNEFFNFPCSFTAKFRNVLPESQILLKHNSQNYIPNYENQWLFSLIIISYYFLNYFKHEHFMLNFYTSVKKGEGLLHARISSKKYVGGICHNATCKSLSFRGLLSAFKQGVCKILTFSGGLYYILTTICCSANVLASTIISLSLFLDLKTIYSFSIRLNLWLFLPHRTFCTISGSSC